MSEPLAHQEEGTDTRTNEELFSIALTEEDEDSAWRAIAQLQTRGNRAIFERACRLCRAEDARARSVGVDILGQLGVRVGHPGHAFHEETMALLLAVAAHEQDPHVLYCIGTALGHRQDPRAIGLLAASRITRMRVCASELSSASPATRMTWPSRP